MNEDERKRLHQLCEMAAKEQDRAKMLKLVREINDLLETKQKRMDSHSGGTSVAP